MKTCQFFIFLFFFSPCYSIGQVQLKKTKNDIVTVTKKDNNLQSGATMSDLNKFDWQRNMPWIAAIITGVLTVIANLIISNLSRRSNAEVAIRQIDNSNSIALAQMDLALKNSQRDFNKTVLSGNRQVWINDIRELISKILSIISTFSLKTTLSTSDLENLRFLITKAELLLSTEDHTVLILLMIDLDDCCLQILMENKTVDDLVKIVEKLKIETISVLKIEWDKVKRGE